MKKTLFILSSILFLGMGTTKAQFVTIPDAKFAHYLDSIIPAAMSGNQMDTTNAAVINLKGISVENMGISNMNGVQYFKKLITLDCGNGYASIDPNQFTSLPLLPGTLVTLICGSDGLTNLPVLPNGLSTLKCYGNNLTSLPSLPANLDSLICANNQITVLPTLPIGLTYLICYSNLLTSLPILPATLLQLHCYSNQLTSLPTLPGGLGDLQCESNQLTSLPALPGVLDYLDCGSNQITIIPTLPGALFTFFCNSNNITSLPALPSTLVEFDCSSNQLTSLSTLPQGLNWFVCNTNNISCFPIFPNTLTSPGNINISGNPFACLPNYVPAMDAGTLAYPLCEPGNPNGCSSSIGILGYVYKDMNSNCTRDKGDSNLSNIPVKIYDKNNNLLSQTYSAINGVYDFQDTGATYTIEIDTTGMPYVVQCIHPGTDSVVTVSSLDTNVNFSFACKSGIDVGVQSVTTNGLIFPGIQHSLSIVAGDMSQWYNLDCANGDSGTVQITVSGPVTYVGPSGGALNPIVSGDVYTYHIANYGAIHNTTAFNLLFQTNKNANTGDSVCVNIVVTPLIDYNPNNNTYHYCYVVVNSHDPNSKEVYPANVPPGYTGWLTYTIHFQNTGSAAANNILISDTLNNNLDLSTFQLLNYSHQNTVSLTGNVLSVRFDGIQLPDSTVNLTGSTGFVQYRIKPKSGLPDNTLITNTGYIYFDYNGAVVTNTTQNLFTSIATSATTITSNTSCKVFPNPNKGTFTVQLSVVSCQSSVEVYNELGQEVYKSALNPGNTEVNLGDKAAGIYFYRVVNENGSLITEGKMMVE